MDFVNKIHCGCVVADISNIKESIDLRGCIHQFFNRPYRYGKIHEFYGGKVVSYQTYRDLLIEYTISKDIDRWYQTDEKINDILDMENKIITFSEEYFIDYLLDEVVDNYILHRK